MYLFFIDLFKLISLMDNKLYLFHVASKGNLEKLKHLFVLLPILFDSLLYLLYLNKYILQ